MRMRTTLTALTLAAAGVLAVAGPAVADTEVTLGHTHTENVQQCISETVTGKAITVPVLSPSSVEACTTKG